jgi:hypothetical protein
MVLMLVTALMSFGKFSLAGFLSKLDSQQNYSSNQKTPLLSPLLGERARVRASFPYPTFPA